MQLLIKQLCLLFSSTHHKVYVRKQGASQRNTIFTVGMHRCLKV